MTDRRNLDRLQTLRRLSALIGLSAALGACTVYGGEVVTASVPNDYRQRHPIAVQEANRSIVVFVGQGRGNLTASQRTDVRGLAQSWLREGTGAIVADVPVGTPNARAAADVFREIRSLLMASGVDSRAITMQNKPFHNFGCATQRNLAAMIDNPADLEQPRPETPAYTPRRDVAFDRYRKGSPTTTVYSDAEKAKLSDTGK